jgi:hypothetical protein
MLQVLIKDQAESYVSHSSSELHGVYVLAVCASRRQQLCVMHVVCTLSKCVPSAGSCG